MTKTLANRQCVRSAKAIVDLGPGTGGTTAALLAHAAPDSRVLAIEKTDEFMEPLSSLEDPRLIVEHGDAVEIDRLLTLHEMPPPDVIVSGIPFSSIPPDTAMEIIRAVHHSLAPGGLFLAYQLRDDVHRYASMEFGKPTSRRWVMWNLPPLCITTWRKHAEHPIESATF